jgi:hypothetical protein
LRSVETEFIDAGGTVISWRTGRAIEEELFLSLPDDGVDDLLDRAIEFHGEDLVNEHIKSASGGENDLDHVRKDATDDGYSTEVREVLGEASRFRKAGWFKSVTWMEGVARDIVGPYLADTDEEFSSIVKEIFTWAGNGE